MIQFEDDFSFRENFYIQHHHNAHAVLMFSMGYYPTISSFERTFSAETKGFPRVSKERPSRGNKGRPVISKMPVYRSQKNRHIRLVLARSSRIAGCGTILRGMLLVCVLFGSIRVPAGQLTTFFWNRSPDAGAIGYRIYYGMASHDYTAMLDVGNVTSATISGLTEGRTYYYALTTYDAAGMESDFSAESSQIALASSSVPVTSPQIQIRSAAAGKIILTVSGPTGHTYEILASPDLKTWTVIATMMLKSGGPLEFADPNAANFPQRFYRLRETVPVEPAFARAQMQIKTGAGKSLKLTVTGLAGHRYDIEATADFMVWTVIGTVTAVTDGPVDFTDPNAGNFSQRFYRTRENP